MRANEYIKMVRLQKGMKQEEVAKQLFVNKSTISQYENGKRSMDVDTYHKILNILGVIEHRLIEDKEKPRRFYNEVYENLKKALQPYPRFDERTIMKMAMEMEKEIDEYDLEKDVIHHLTPYYLENTENEKEAHDYEVGFLLGEESHAIGFNPYGEEIGYSYWIKSIPVEKDEEYEKMIEDIQQELFEQIEHIHESGRAFYIRGFCRKVIPSERTNTEESLNELKERFKKEINEKIKEDRQMWLQTEVICFIRFNGEIDKEVIEKYHGQLLSKGLLTFAKQEKTPVARIKILNTDLLTLRKEPKITEDTLDNVMTRKIFSMKYEEVEEY